MRPAETLRSRVTTMIDREIDRCKNTLGPEDWRAHGAWVTQHIVAGAKEWLVQQASKGAL